MKKFYLIRHAKSSWKNICLEDFKRPLNKRGLSNAPMMGARLKNSKIIPDLIISSPAFRAKHTAHIIAEKINYKDEIELNEDIYEASLNTLVKIIKNIDDVNSVVFLFGHNPSFNDFAEYFVNFYENIPTSGVVEIEFDCKKWKAISAKNAKLISFDYPKKQN